jgi:hypothetical protein
MGFVNKNGQYFEDWSDYLESIGYEELSVMEGGGYIDPNGNRVSNSQANQALIAATKKGELYPDAEHLAEFRGYGYTGPEASEAAAQNFAEKELAGLPEFQSLIDKETGLLTSPYTLQSPESLLGKFEDITNQYGLPGYSKAMLSVDELGNIARSTGFSPYAQAQLEQQKLEEAGLRDVLTGQIMGAKTTALSNLASTGGYDSGARERVLSNVGLQGLLGGQQIGRQGFQTRADIGASDALYKQNLLSALPGQYSSLATTGMNLWNPYMTQATTEQGYDWKTGQYNIDKALAEKGSQRSYDLEKAKMKQQLTASARQSYAESPNPYSYTSDIYR